MSMMFDPAMPPPLSFDERLAERVAALERKLRTFEGHANGGSIGQLPVVTALPTAGRKGRLVVLDSDNKVYVDSGAAWVVVGTQA